MRTKPVTIQHPPSPRSNDPDAEQKPITPAPRDLLFEALRQELGL